MRRRGLRGAVAVLFAALPALPALPAAAGEVALSFPDAPGGSASGFRIERRAAGADAFEPLALVGPGVVEFVDRSVRPGRLLCYRVRPLASRGDGDWSSEVCARAKESGAPPAPATTAATTAAGDAPQSAAADGPPNAAAEAPAAAAGDGVSNAPSADRRVRAGGGWLQVLE